MSDVKELSEKNPYRISKHRKYELIHFCLQYDEWMKELRESCAISGRDLDAISLGDGRGWSDPTFRLAAKHEKYYRWIKMIRDAADLADSELSDYIFLAAVKGHPYAALSTQFGIPCCKDVYYEARNRFFYILSEMRN